MSIMESLFGGRSGGLLGIDISSSAVKLLELGRKGDRYQVEAYAVEPLPANAVNDKQITEPQVVGECIARAVQRAGTKTRNAAVAVAGAVVITKVIQMPANLSDADLEEQIKVEADQYIPYPIEDVYLDFQVLGISEKNPSHCDVLLAACRREQVEQRCSAVEIAGLTPKLVDIEAYALENACELLRAQMPAEGRNKTIAVVDIGANTTSLVVLHDLKTIYTRDQAFGGKQLTEDIMRHYAMTFEEAGRAKRYGNLPPEYATLVLPGFVADMAQQIDRSLQFFFASSSQYSSIDQILLAGGCAHIPNIDALVQEHLGIPTAVARPLAGMLISAKAKPAALAKDEAALLIACGLAMRALDGPRR